jgi:putative FmdB family regulatory protein
MPTYEYVCSACDNHWEEVQRITADSTEVCPRCHKKTAHRQISAGNFILKGGGWYSDLYSSPKPAKAESSEGGKSEAKSEAKAESSGSKGESKGETKGETKSETKSEKKDSGAPAAASPSTSPPAGGSTKE